MGIGTAPRTRESVRRHNFALKRHKKIKKTREDSLAQLAKDLTVGEVQKLGRVKPLITLSPELKQSYLKFSQLHFDGIDQYFAKIFCSKILPIYQLARTRKISFLDSVSNHQFQKLWRLVERKLEVKGREDHPKRDRMKIFQSLYIKYLMPFEQYLTSGTLRSYKSMVLPVQQVLHPHLFTLRFISEKFVDQSHCLIKLNPSLYMNPSTFPTIKGTAFKETKTLPLENFPSVHSKLQQKFPQLFYNPNQQSFNQGNQTLLNSAAIHYIDVTNIRELTFDGASAAVFINISNQSVEWLVIEDGHFEKVAQELNESRLSLIDNGRKISDNFMDLASKGCSILSLLQKPRTHLFLNSGCFAWAKGNHSILIRASFEIKSYRQLQASLFRKSLSDYSKKVPQAAHKLRIFLNECDSQHSSYLVRAYKDIQRCLNKQMMLLNNLNIYNMIQKTVSKLQDEESYCRVCKADILMYFFEDPQKEKMVTCLNCIKAQSEQGFKIQISVRMEERALNDVFNQYKKLCLMQEEGSKDKGNNREVQGRRGSLLKGDNREEVKKDTWSKESKEVRNEERDRVSHLGLTLKTERVNNKVILISDSDQPNTSQYVKHQGIPEERKRDHDESNTRGRGGDWERSNSRREYGSQNNNRGRYDQKSSNKLDIDF